MAIEARSIDWMTEMQSKCKFQKHYEDILYQQLSFVLARKQHKPVINKIKFSKPYNENHN